MLEAMNALQRHLKVRSYPDQLAFYIEEEEQDLKSSRGTYIFFVLNSSTIIGNLILAIYFYKLNNLIHVLI